MFKVQSTAILFLILCDTQKLKMLRCSAPFKITLNNSGYKSSGALHLKSMMAESDESPVSIG